MAVTADPGVQTVLDNMQTIVASEGGSLEFLELSGGKLSVYYKKGVNEECPECVPDHDMVKMMLESSLGIYAPQVSELELT
jgi:hypothetical protein